MRSTTERVSSPELPPSMSSSVPSLFVAQLLDQILSPWRSPWCDGTARQARGARLLVSLRRSQSVSSALPFVAVVPIPFSSFPSFPAQSFGFARSSCGAIVAVTNGYRRSLSLRPVACRDAKCGCRRARGGLARSLLDPAALFSFRSSLSSAHRGPVSGAPGHGKNNDGRAENNAVRILFWREIRCRVVVGHIFLAIPLKWKWLPLSTRRPPTTNILLRAYLNVLRKLRRGPTKTKGRRTRASQSNQISHQVRLYVSVLGASLCMLRTCTYQLNSRHDDRNDERPVLSSATPGPPLLSA